MSSSLRIVVAEDDADIRDYYVRLIPRLGHVLIDHVSNGIELVEACLGDRPDLVVSDVQMPELDGISAMQRVQQQADIPFIFVSAEDASDHQSTLDHGNVLKYLQKPIRQTQLAAALRAASAAVPA